MSGTTLRRQYPNSVNRAANVGNRIGQDNQSIAVNGPTDYPIGVPPVVGTDHVYFDLTFYNNSEAVNSSEQFIPAKVIQTNSVEIIDNPTEWNLTIARFSISSDSIGRVYQPIGTTGGNTTLFAGLTYLGVHYDEPIVLPTMNYPNGVNVQVVFDVNDFIDLINAAWAAAQVSVAGAGGPTGYQPIMTYDPSTGLYTINSPEGYGTYTGGSGGTGVQITMSYDLWHKFQSFSAIENDPIQYNNHDVTIKVLARGDNITTLQYPAGTTGLYYQMRQDAAWPASIMD